VKKLAVVLIALALLLLPLAARWLYYYDVGAGSGRPAIARPDLSQVVEPALAARDFQDKPGDATPGIIVVDQAHDNRVRMSELAVLQARLAARGQSLEPLTDADDLGDCLRYARALIVASPGTAWQADEIEEVARFVDKGGRLLLITDPARYDVLYDEWGTFSAVDADAAHINDLAARFGLFFQSDYLYNVQENEGNYRHIRLTDFASHPLTEGLEQLVLPGTHSITSREEPLVWATGATRSSSSEREGNLAVAALAAGGRVLGLGDLSFLLEPYNTLYDNDRFIANIADLLAGAERRYELEDFPFFFEDEVDLIFAGDPLLGAEVIAAASDLQDLLGERGLRPALRAEEDGDRDTVLLGLFEGADEVEPYLSDLGVTLVVTPTGEMAEDGEKRATADDAEEDAEPTVDRIVIEGVGQIPARGSALLAFREEGDRQMLLILAGGEETLGSLVERLAAGDLEGCLFGRDGELAVCPVEETESPAGGKGRPEAREEPAEEAPAEPEGEEEPALPGGEEPPAGAGASIIVISLDEGQGRYDSMTGVADFQAILEEHFEVTIWSKARDGAPAVADLRDHDLVIWTAGDYEDAFGEAESGLLFALMLEDIPVLVSGAYIGSAREQAVQRDLQVEDASHPLAQGFDAGEVIPFVEAPSGSEYEIDVLTDLADGETDVVLVRGPDSESSGVPSLAVMSDAVSNTRVVFAGFPIYLLPEPAKSRLVLNTVSWMLSPGQG